MLDTSQKTNVKTPGYRRLSEDCLEVEPGLGVCQTKDLEYGDVKQLSGVVSESASEKTVTSRLMSIGTTNGEQKRKVTTHSIRRTRCEHSHENILTLFCYCSGDDIGNTHGNFREEKKKTGK